jgi:hypothetical protein
MWCKEINGVMSKYWWGSYQGGEKDSLGEVTTKKLAYRGGFEKLKTASIDYQTASIDMNAL